MELEGESREAAASALRSSRRMRRLVADLLLLARADAGRVARARAARPLRGRHRGRRRARARGRRPPDQRQRRRRAPRWRARATSCTGSRSTCSRTRCATPIRAPPSRRRWSGATARSCCSVEDDGPGIPPELHDKVFERFFRGAGDRSGSSGLGLSIVRAVAGSHAGHRVAGAAAGRPRRALRRAVPRARPIIRPDGPSQQPTSRRSSISVHVRLSDQKAESLAVGGFRHDTAHQCDSRTEAGLSATGRTP